MSDNRSDNRNQLAALAAGAAQAWRRGDVAVALRAGADVLRADPKNLAMLRLCAAAAKKLRNWQAAVRIGELWRDSYPDDPKAIRALANAYFEFGDTQKSRETFKVLLDANPDSAEYLGLYARLCLEAFEYEEATAALEKARALGPLSADNLHAFSRLKYLLGDLKDAEALSAKAIETDPDFVRAYPQYTTIRGGDVDDKVRAQMERLAEDNKRPPEHRSSLYFALGNIDHFNRDYPEAMKAFHRGNGLIADLLRAEGLAYDPKALEDYRRREDDIARALPEAHDFPPGPAIPIFVVGMPRSGTTLVESILAAHPDVFGAGELVALPDIQIEVLRWAQNADGKSLADAPRAQLETWRGQYFARYPDIQKARYVVDKQPMNFRWAGLIKALFPESAIIHIRRNPVDTGFSIYRNDFSKAWPFAVGLDSIAHFYGEYARITTQWEDRLGADFPLVVYEDLIADFEPEARRLVERCGLDWRDECLDFHRAERPIATFSAVQVRQPLRTKTAKTREKYGALLDPLIEGLARAGVDIDTGAVRAGP